MKLSDKIDRKFVESFDVSNWEVETEEGFVDILSSNKTIEYTVYLVKLDNKLELKCADTHILIDEWYNEVFAKDSLGIKVRTKLGNSLVISVENLGYTESMYDLSIDSKPHTFYANDILSHNTTTAAAYLLYYVIFNDHKTVAILANKSAAAREVMSRVQLMFEGLPIWLQQGIKTWNKGDIELENGSKIFTAATTSSGIRGKSVNMLYIDEISSIANNVAEEFFTSTYPVISAGKDTKILMTSTPIGFNYWWKVWNEAENGINGFIPFKAEWYEHPDRDEKWAKEQKGILGEVKFNQEVLCHFLGSANTLINGSTLSQMSPKPFIYSTPDGLDILEKPEPNHFYTITVDTSEGVGGDFSAFIVIDITSYPFKLVAKYKNNKISPMLYPNVIYKVAVEYNNAHILVEINKSQEVASILYDEYEYENMISVKRGTKGQIPVDGGYSKGILGVTTDKKVKRQGCLALKSIVEENKLLIFDTDIISEFSTFIEKGTSYAADSGAHDDLVMCLILFAWLSTSEYFKDMTNMDTRKELYQSHMDMIEANMLPVGWLDDGSSFPQYINF
jgi:hypothetical protein